jgi:hypothetical protein
MSGFSEEPFLGRPGDRTGAGLDLLSAACCAFADFLRTTARLDFFAFGTWNPGNLGMLTRYEAFSASEWPSRTNIKEFLEKITTSRIRRPVANVVASDYWWSTIHLYRHDRVTSIDGPETEGRPFQWSGQFGRRVTRPLIQLKMAEVLDVRRGSQPTHRRSTQSIRSASWFLTAMNVLYK